jgi:hypothetical protein
MNPFKGTSIIIFLLHIFSLNLPLLGATYYVSGISGSDSNPGTESGPWNTIGQANSKLQPGDTVLIKAGEYLETIRPEMSGTSGKHITYARYGNDEVFITGQNYGADFTGKSYINIDGLIIHDNTVNVWVSQHGDHNIIQNCKMYNCNQYYLILIRGGSYNQILNNDLSRGTKADPVGNIISIGRLQNPEIINMYNLVEGNVFHSDALNCHASLGLSGLNTKFNIVRNNVSYGTRRFLGLGGSTRNLIEKNKAYNHGHNHLSEDGGSRQANEMQFNGRFNILRFNEFFEHENTGRNANLVIGLSSDVSNTGEDLEYCKIYNNTIWNNSYHGIAMHSWRNPSPPMEHNTFKNNILYNNGTKQGYQVFYYYGENRITTDVWDGNLMGKADSLGEDVISFLKDPKNERYQYTLSEAIRYLPEIFLPGNLEGNPLFVSSANHDFKLQTSSPCINAGAFLTQTTGAGSGTTVPVEDAGYFLDGWGLIQGDLIQLEGQDQTARIIGVDYEDNIITVDQALPAWSEGTGVSLPYEGSAPDIGVHEYSGGLGLKGDINSDEILDITDVLALILRGLYNPDNQSLDYNGDGSFSITDAIELLFYIRRAQDSQGELASS